MNINADCRAVATRDRPFVNALVPPLRSLPQASQVGNLLVTHANFVTSLEMRLHVTFATLLQSTCYTLR
jgi:hypothetical protein